MSMSSFGYQGATCVVMGAKRILRAGGWKSERGSWVTGQSIYSMGLTCSEVRILAQRATTLSKGFFLLSTYCYT